MNYKCLNCKENFKGKKNNSLQCPFCGSYIIDEKLIKDIEKEFSGKEYSKEDIDELINKKEAFSSKIKGTKLEAAIKYIESMFKLLKNPEEEVKNKIIAATALIYAVNPIDLIPDAIPVVGYIDDCGAIMLAVSMLGVALKKYLSKNENTETKNKDQMILFNISSNINNSITEVNFSNGIVEWIIPRNKMDKIDIKTIDGKLLSCNKTYVLVTNEFEYLVPLDDFDEIISKSIFDEASKILKCLGAKSISYEKDIAIALDKKVAISTEFSEIFNGECNISNSRIKIKKHKEESGFDNFKISEELVSDEILDSLVWFFTDKSILRESIFSERFERGLVKTKIIKELELKSLLDINNRGNVKKYFKGEGNISINEAMKVKWVIDVEYHSLSDVDKVKLGYLYSNLKLRLKRRRDEIANQVIC